MRTFAAALRLLLLGFSSLALLTVVLHVVDLRSAADALDRMATTLEAALR